MRDDDVRQPAAVSPRLVIVTLSPPLVAATVSLPLAAIGLLAASIWTGGIVAMIVVARAASRTLAAGERIALFRAIGRSYGAVATVSLLVALAAGALLLRGHPWSATQVAAAIVAAALLLATAAGVLQARAMTRLRGRVLREEPEGSVRGPLRRNARLAAALRGAIGLLTVALMVLGAALARS